MTPWRTKNHEGFLAMRSEREAMKAKRAYEYRNVAPPHPKTIVEARKGPNQP